jgi:hypothetical protein
MGAGALHPVRLDNSELDGQFPYGTFVGSVSDARG